MTSDTTIALKLDGHTKRALVMSLKRVGMTREQARAACDHAERLGAVSYTDALRVTLAWKRTQQLENAP